LEYIGISTKNISVEGRKVGRPEGFVKIKRGR